ncbi:MAG: dienelactone hydrolase family protein [Magnetospirillum sp.]|nr:dienelactone hydrolase family protein [Magnetospirillum sp.]
MTSPSEITLSGPSVAPASGGPAAQLVVLLHGVGVDGSDLIGLAPFFAAILPDAAFVAPDAPFAFDMAPFGRQWFSLQDRSVDVISAGVRATAPILDAFIDEQIALWGVGESDVALIGFSQGTMMALHVALRRQRAPAAVVGFSGALVDAPSLPAEITARPRVLLVHGADDEVVNPDCLEMAERALASVGVPVLAELRPGLGHGIDGPGAQMALGFLGQVFGIGE